jgi:uncharacterized hydrophobic protein (TIGR00271 family)
MASEGPARTDVIGHTFSVWRHWWQVHVADTVEQAEVIARRREECQLTGRYLFMLAMSAGIAILGLLLSSPAVVIGAMLLSPLMGPIMGLGFALAIGDVPWLKESGRSLALGTLMSVALCALIVFFSPLQTVTSEIAARTRPNLFDLLVAVFSALAGAYAMIRGREGTVVGVAIATALMPPLAVVGFGLATLNWTVFSGALLLFVTNLIAIALIAAIMARLYGFRTTLSERNTRLQMAGILVVFVALAVPLGISLMQIRNEAIGARQIRGAVLDGFGSNSRLSDLQINWDARPIQVSATVLTPEIKPEAEAIASRVIARTISDPVDLTITQYRVGTGAQAAEEAQLAAARAREEASVQRAERLKARLALIAGVEETDVLTDREARRAMVTAQPLEGATLAAYRELETRISRTEPEWSIQLRPPARPLPSIAVEDGEPTEAGLPAFSLAVWAGQRLLLPVLVSGQSEDAEGVVELLRAQQVDARVAPESAPRGQVDLRWGNPAAE